MYDRNLLVPYSCKPDRFRQVFRYRYLSPFRIVESCKGNHISRYGLKNSGLWKITLLCFKSPFRRTWDLNLSDSDLRSKLSLKDPLVPSLWMDEVDILSNYSVRLRHKNTYVLYIILRTTSQTVSWTLYNRSILLVRKYSI